MSETLDPARRWTLRLATVDDVEDVAGLLDDFNFEFDTPTPGRSVLADRLRVLLAGDTTLAIVAGRPPVAVALVTMRTNIWYGGEVALLDEMYVAPELRGRGIGSSIVQHLILICAERRVELIEINVDEGDTDAQRFYERHGFSSTDSGSAERAFYYFRESSYGDEP